MERARRTVRRGPGTRPQRAARGPWVGLAVVAGLALACAGSPESFSTGVEATNTFPDSPSAAGWSQWGGPNSDFTVSDAGLAAAWPSTGPPTLWSRPLGPGYSAIAAHRGALFTMYRDGDDDVTVALRADDGSAIWEQRYAAPTRPKNQTRFGEGPNATPLLLEDRLITLSYAGQLSCRDAATGELLWSHDLIDDLGGEVLDFGYSASPIVHRGRVIVLVGGEAQGAVAFDPADGSIVWRGHPSSVSYATPLVIDVDGQEQLIYFSADEVIGLEASTGGLLWSRPCVNQYRNNATGPLWGKDNLLWVATQLDGGTRALKLRQAAGRVEVVEIWSKPNINLHFWNSLRIGDHVYASIGGQGSILAGIDARTGEIRWRERGFDQVNLIQAGGKTIMLDSAGTLILAELSPEGVEVRARARVIDGVTWTVPTLVGSTLYLRDQRSIRALDLG